MNLQINLDDLNLTQLVTLYVMLKATYQYDQAGVVYNTAVVNAGEEDVREEVWRIYQNEKL